MTGIVILVMMYQRDAAVANTIQADVRIVFLKNLQNNH